MELTYRRCISFALLLLALTVQACKSGDATDPGNSVKAPADVDHLVNVTPDSVLVGIVDRPLTRVAVRAEDSLGHAVAGTPIIFFVSEGGGEVDTATVLTDSAGIATSGVWKLGVTSGRQVVRAHAPFAAATSFIARALPEVAVGMEMVAGDRQVILSGTPTAVAPAVRVVDRFGNGVGGIPVSFSAQSGSVSNAQVTTDTAGVAMSGTWSPGITGDVGTLIASSPLLPNASITFHARVVTTLFRISVRYVEAEPEARVKLAMERAVARWQSVLSDHSGISAVKLAATTCGKFAPAVDEVVTDLIVFVRVTAIDGPANILAEATPCAYHEETKLPAVGRILLDERDVATFSVRDRIDFVLTHELGHVLGFGSIWDTQGLLNGAGTTDPIFTGGRAIAEFRSAANWYTGRVVPVENTGGAGTADGHWRETVFGDELMTGYLRSQRAPLGRVTVAALEDMGYAVSYDGAEVHQIIPAAASIQGGSVLELRENVSAPLPGPGTIMPSVQPVRRDARTRSDVNVQPRSNK